MGKKVINWTPLAIESFDEIAFSIGNQWGDTILADFTDSIDAYLIQIQTFPSLAPKLHLTNFKRGLLHKHISIFYEDLPNNINILLLWDNRQNPAELKRKLGL